MGAVLQKPVMSTAIDRVESKQFSIGVAEVNGWRNSMEDAHLIHLRDGWGIFGVFDGHGGDQCSKWIAKRLKEEFDQNGCPDGEAAIEELFLRVDKEFLDTETPSGTTATMCIVHKLASGKNRLQVINAGDSRVLLGRRDGTMVDGPGTDKGLTTDHKPNDPVEKERIERCGGTVEVAQGGVYRLNGDLAVCRGFGDRDYKKQGPDKDDLKNQPATACPEIGTFECDDADFVLLVCDGVSEGDFPNDEVVKFVAAALKEHGNIGYAAKGVCFKAVDKNSKDNITCMIVLLNGDGESAEGEHSSEFIPGSLLDRDRDVLGDKNFVKAYEAMATRAKLTLAQALEMRYEILEKEMDEADESKRDDARDEMKKIGNVVGDKGSEERRSWFEEYAERLKSQDSGGGGDMTGGVPLQLLQQLQFLRPPQGDRAKKVRTPSCEVLKKAVDEHSALQWDQRMEEMVDCVVEVLQVDDSDGTTQVRVNGDNGHPPMSAWLPSEILKDV